jgi:hypothetical protein
LLKKWSEPVSPRKKREVFVSPIATVKPPRYRVPTNEDDEEPAFNVDNPGTDLLYDDETDNAVEDEQDSFRDVPMIDASASDVNPFAVDRDHKHVHSKSSNAKTAATSKPGFVVRVQQHENAWEFHRLKEEVVMLHNVVGDGDSKKLEESEVWTEDVEVACYTAADTASGIFPLLGNCIPRPHRHSRKAYIHS